MNTKRQFADERSQLPYVSTIVPWVPVLGRGHTVMGATGCRACKAGDDKHHCLGGEKREKVAEVYAR